METLDSEKILKEINIFKSTHETIYLQKLRLKTSTCLLISKILPFFNKYPQDENFPSFLKNVYE